MIYMTLLQIAEHYPGSPSWNKTLTLLDKTEADDTEISLLDVLEKLSVQDAIWCFRVNWFEHKPLYMQFIKNCASRARKYANSAAADNSAAKFANNYAKFANNYINYADNYVNYAEVAASYAEVVANYAKVAASYAKVAANCTLTTASYAKSERQLQYDDLKRLLTES